MNEPKPPPASSEFDIHSTAKRVAEVVSPWQLLVGILAGCVITGATMWANIRSAAREAVTDEKFLGELSGKVRPLRIFDVKGAIHVDLGTGDYIEDIKVEHQPQRAGLSVYLKCKRHLAYPPLVTCLNANIQTEQSERRAGNDWYFLLTPLSSYGDPAGKVWDTNSIPFDFQWNYKFMVEILH